MTVLGQLKGDIDYFLNEKSEEEKKKEEKNENDINPFLALFGYYIMINQKRRGVKRKERGEV
jgi:hypothetical protein